jgi:hypothetical protein
VAHKVDSAIPSAICDRNAGIVSARQYTANTGLPLGAWAGVKIWGERAKIVVGLAAGGLLFSGTAQAVPFADGDVFASVIGGIQHYSASGALLETLTGNTGSNNTGGAIDAAGNLYATHFRGGEVNKFAGRDDPHTQSTFGGNFGAGAESIVRDLNGNFYISNSASGAITKVDAAGNTLATFSTGSRADFIELNLANMKLFFTRDISKGVGVLDIATNSLDSAFSTTVGNFALRLLGNGDLLVANEQDIKLLDRSGNVIKTYDDGGNENWFALNLDPDGTSFWSGDSGTGVLDKFDISSGDVLETIDTGVGRDSLFGVTVFGEITQGTGGGGGGIGVAEPATLLLIGVGLFGLSLRRRQA